MIKQLTVLAPGLLGGSVAMAAHAKGLASRTVIWARRPEVRAALETQSWCQGTPATLAEAVKDADFVVLAAPVERIIELSRDIAPHLAPEGVVTDVGSVKGHLSRMCHAALGGRFVGAHPMAGSAKTGWENGEANLFENRTCFVTPLPETRPEANERVARFWMGTGSRVFTVTPDEHDEIVANISHLPQALATSLCSRLAALPSAWREFAGGGLRDTTRIASSDATMWIEIFQQNRDEVLRALGGFEDELHGLKAAITNRDWPEVRARLERGKQYRDGFRAAP
ncbi:MAG: prephenate dehydrogenase/arogenate dehydrogenase family protein [Opitutaceae bacterium]|nr:prephenate dehydrogenase/arogenate dehydrogenase family protein [Opitutaceae bacterium]